MSTPDNDRDLRTAFAILRDGERRSAPAFGVLLSPSAQRRATRPRWAFTTVAVAASIAIVGLVVHTSRVASGPSLEESITIAEAMSSWSAPSDEFAALSGAGIREGVPDLDMTSVTLPEWTADDAGPTD